MRFFVLMLAGAVSLCVQPSARAQMLDPVPVARGPSRGSFGLGLMVAQPRGEFNQYIDTGGGIGGHFMYGLDRLGVLGIRLDLGFVGYGHETKRVPLSPYLGRIRVDVTTSNNIFVLGLGPQLMVPKGAVRPYVNGSVGLSHFFTESRVEGSSDDLPFATSTNFSDGTFAWTGGGGLYIPLRRGAQPISLDLGARYHSNGRARYLREGSIQDTGPGEMTFTPIESETNLVVYHLGVSFGR